MPLNEDLIKAHPAIQGRFRIVDQPDLHLFQGFPGVIPMVSVYVAVNGVADIDNEMLFEGTDELKILRKIRSGNGRERIWHY